MDVQIAIIGGGLSGLGLAAKLKTHGIEDLVIYEKSTDVGGTWRDNIYPGCQCDVPSHMYSFSFFPNPNWSRVFAPQEEIYEYIKSFVAHFNLDEKIKYSHEAINAYWDENLKCWRISFKDKPEIKAQFLVAAIGPLSYPQIPHFMGLESFKGITMHSANFDKSVNLTGKKVGVIGTGASAIQIVPSVADNVESLYVLQRTPAWILPRADRKYSAVDKWLFKNVRGYQRLIRSMMYLSREALVPALTKKPRRLKVLEFLAKSHLNMTVKDKELVKKLTPNFRIGCKRILLSNEYYPTFNKPNVHLVTDPISHFYSDGIELKDGQRIDLDVVIFATGFKVTDHPGFSAIIGKSKKTLADIWQKEGMSAYLGTMVPDFPNFFTILGPNTGLGHNSMIFMMESQYNLIWDAIRTVNLYEKSSVEPKPEIVRHFHQELQNRLKSSVWATGCASWYLDEKGNVPTMWPGFTWEFWLKTRRIKPRDVSFS